MEKTPIFAFQTLDWCWAIINSGSVEKLLQKRFPLDQSAFPSFEAEDGEEVEAKRKSAANGSDAKTLTWIRHGLRKKINRVLAPT